MREPSGVMARSRSAPLMFSAAESAVVTSIRTTCEGDERIAGHAPGSPDLRLGLTHSPEPRVLDGFAADGYDLVLAGHTHGGQLRLPGYGAIVTNCGIDRSRARGASRWGAHMWLHVSAGLGTAPTAPVRFACPPEASLLTLVPRPTGPAAALTTPAKAVADVG